MPPRARLRAALPSALAAAMVLPLAAPAAASTGSAQPAGHHASFDVLRLKAMPAGVVTFGRNRHWRLTVHVRAYGLTPGSSHAVDLVIPKQRWKVRFSTLTAGSTGRANTTLTSWFTGQPPAGSRLVIRMGVAGRLGRRVIAHTKPLWAPGHWPQRLIAVEIGRHGRNWGTPEGWAVVFYQARRHTLTVAVHASGLTPGFHAAHIHLGSCRNQGPIKYALRDLLADRHGLIRHAVRVFRNVTTPIPRHGWYLNIHQGNSRNFIRNGQPTILFRPLLCADVGRHNKH